jgi:hypothetical protein
VRNHPELKDAQIMRLVGTTKTTIASVRDRTHWNASTLTPMDPVTLGLCSQIELDFEVQRAAKEKPVPPITAAPRCCRPPRPPARAGIRADRKAARRSQRRRRVRQAEDHRRQEGGGGVRAPHGCLGFTKRGGSLCRVFVLGTDLHDSAGPSRIAGSRSAVKPRNLPKQIVRDERLDQDRNAGCGNRTTTLDRMSPVMTMAGTSQARASRKALIVSIPFADPRRL